MNTQQKFLGGIILGVAVGSAILFLTKTKKGRDFLDDITDSAEDLSKNLKGKYSDVSDNLKGKYGDISDDLRDRFDGFEKEMKKLIKKGKSFIEDLEDKAKDLASSLK